MRAEQTRRGGRYVARERGSETESAPNDCNLVAVPLHQFPLIERLRPQSLALVAELLGVGVDELQNRYT